MTRYVGRPRAALLPALLATLLLAGCRGGDPLPTAVAPLPAAARVSADATPTPRDPGRPTVIPASAVEAELAAARREAEGAHHAGVSDVARSIRAFDLALTSRALRDVAFGALVMLAEQRGPDSRTLREHLYRSFNRAAASVRPSAALGFATGDPCVVSFDQSNLIDDFAEPTDPQALFTSDPQWRQSCGVGQLHVEPLVYGHLHLVFEDQTIDCLDLDTGLMGRDDDGDCEPLADAFAEPRYLGVHTGKEVVRIQRRSGNVALPFTVHTFVVVGPEPIRFRWRTGNGPWMQWNELAGNTVWDVSAYVVGATEVQITHAGTSFACGTDFVVLGPPGTCPVGGPWFSLDDIAITP